MQQQADLHEQQLLEHEALARDQSLRPGRAGGARRAPRRRAPAGRCRARSAAGQRVGQPPHGRPHGAQQAAQQARRDLFARRVHGHDALGVHRVALFLFQDLVALDDERGPTALRPVRAAQAEAHALVEHLDQVALVEPDRLDGARCRLGPAP